MQGTSEGVGACGVGDTAKSEVCVPFKNGLYVYVPMGTGMVQKGFSAIQKEEKASVPAYLAPAFAPMGFGRHSANIPAMDEATDIAEIPAMGIAAIDSETETVNEHPQELQQHESHP